MRRHCAPGHRRGLRRSLILILVLLITLFSSGSTARAAGSPTQYSGTLPNGVTQYLFEIPSNWNGTLFFYSHGISYGPLYAQDSSDDFMHNWLLSQGFALAGGSYADAGYEPGLQYPAQLAVLDAFDGIVGRHPSRTIAWGHSGGGQIVADLVQFAPNRFAGAVAMCPFRLAGGIGSFNRQLDHMFVLKTLLGFSRPLVNIGFGHGQLSAFENEEFAVFDAATATAEGRARFALAEAMLNRPDWDLFDPLAPRPAMTDYATRADNIFTLAYWDTYADKERGYLEARIAKAIGTFDYNTGSLSGVNFSWNTGVNYAQLLARSTNADLVSALYRQAGLDLERDLAKLAAAPRIAADPGAIVRLEAIQPIFGPLRVPVVTLYSVGDPYVYINDAQAYAQSATSSRDNNQDSQGNNSDEDNGSNLRQLFIPRGGHCEYTGAEEAVAVGTLLTRLDKGAWPSTKSAALNARASAMGPEANQFVIGSLMPMAHQPGFMNFTPPPFLRNFNTTTRNPYP